MPDPDFIVKDALRALEWVKMQPAFHAEIDSYRPIINQLNAALGHHHITVSTPSYSRPHWHIEAHPDSITGTYFDFDSPTLESALRMAWVNLVGNGENRDA